MTENNVEYHKSASGSPFALALLDNNCTEFDCACLQWQGRDANRKLQRSIKAGKQRERVPGLVEQLRQVLTHWQMEHRLPFTYDGFDYRVSSFACFATATWHLLI